MPDDRNLRYASAMSNRVALFQLGGTVVGCGVGFAVMFSFGLTSSLWGVLVACTFIFVCALVAAWLGVQPTRTGHA